MKNLESNKLIADFMNVQPIQYDEHYQWNDGVYFSVSGVEKDKVLQHIYEYVKYAESWNWLMPVVEKISKLDTLDKERDFNRALDRVLCLPIDAKIDVVYFSVVEFIKWYNKNK